MNLVLEIINETSHSIFESTMTFNENGGKIGRNKQMDWVLHDPTKYISNFHAEITYSNNQYYITDKSSNGISFKNPLKKLTKNTISPLSENSIIIIGKYEINVKFLNNTFLDKGVHTGEKNINDDFGIPDQFFTGNETEKAFDIISNKEKSNDILSLVDDESRLGSNEILPDLDNIMGDFEETAVSGDNGLNIHIDIPSMEKKPVPERPIENVSSTSDEKLFQLLTTKLGINIDGMSYKEKEDYIVEIANIVDTTIEYAQTTAQSVNTIKAQMGLEEEVSSTLFTQGIPTHQILTHTHRAKKPLSNDIKSLFHDINTHNIALYTAISNVSLDMLVQFSPQKLYFTFEQENLLNKKLANKKALAWEAYSERYKHLNILTHKEDVDMSILKKEYKSVLNTLNLGH